MEIIDQSAHREWLGKVKGTKISEITGAKAMPGLEYMPLGGLVVSDEIKDWNHIKQPLIPLMPAETDEESAKSARSQLRSLRDQLNSQDGFLVLIKDKDMGGENQWALSIINPKELSLSEKELRSGMEISYTVGLLALGSSSRAALLAVTGKQTI